MENHAAGITVTRRSARPPGRGPRTAGASARRRAASAGAGLAAASLAMLTGCSSAGSQPSPAATVTVTASAAAGTATASAAASTAAPPPSAAAPAPATAAVPVLGQLTGIFARGQGFGQVRPARIFNGGDPTGLVTAIIWRSWGGSSATGTGMSDYVGPGQTVAGGSRERATVVAFNLGTCHGRLMYQAVEWYFPEHGQAFSPNQYENICAGRYLPAP